MGWGKWNDVGLLCCAANPVPLSRLLNGSQWASYEISLDDANIARCPDMARFGAAFRYFAGANVASMLWSKLKEVMKCFVAIWPRHFSTKRLGARSDVLYVDRISMFEMKSPKRPLNFYEIIGLFVLVCYTTCSERLLLYTNNCTVTGQTEHNLEGDKKTGETVPRPLFKNGIVLTFHPYGPYVYLHAIAIGRKYCTSTGPAPQKPEIPSKHIPQQPTLPASQSATLVLFKFSQQLRRKRIWVCEVTQVAKCTENID